jgi:hypothetical protein
MRKLKSYDEFLNEENVIRNIALGGALAGSLMGSPNTAVGQEIDSQEITGKYGVDDIESAEGIFLEDTRDFDRLILSVKEMSDRVEKNWSIISVEDLDEWGQYRLKLSEKNLSPVNKNETEVYIPKEDFEEFKNTDTPTSWIINSFITLEESSKFLNRNKVQKQTDDKTYRL